MNSSAVSRPYLNLLLSREMCSFTNRTAGFLFSPQMAFAPQKSRFSVALFSSLLNATQSVTSSDGGSLPPPLSPLLIQETLLADAKTDPHETVVLEEQLLDEVGRPSSTCTRLSITHPEQVFSYSKGNLYQALASSSTSTTPWGWG